MIGALLSGLFDLILNIVGSIIQVILLPVNALFNGVFPDFSTWVNNIVQGFGTITGNLSWAISLIPPLVRDALLLIFTIEITLNVVLRSTHLTSKLWNIVQKLKFW